MLLAAATVIGAAVFWPLDIAPAEAESPEDRRQTALRDADDARELAADPLWKRRFQTWQNKLPADAAAAPKQVVKPPPPPTLQIELPAGFSYQGAIFENHYAFGFFNTPAGPRYLSAGQSMKVGDQVMKVLRIDPETASVEYQGRTLTMPLQRPRPNPAAGGRPPSAPSPVIPSMSRPPGPMQPIVLDRKEMKPANP